MKYALIGCGRISVNHIQAALNNKLEIVGLCDLKKEKINSKIIYWKLYKIFENEDYFYLYLDKTHAFLLSKQGFDIGTPEEFREFIKKKCIFKFRK